MTAEERAEKLAAKICCNHDHDACFDGGDPDTLVPALTAAIRAAEDAAVALVRGTLHEHSLIAADMAQEGWTDRSTPLFQRVRNIIAEVQNLRATSRYPMTFKMFVKDAEDAATLKERERCRRIAETWRDPEYDSFRGGDVTGCSAAFNEGLICTAPAGIAAAITSPAPTAPVPDPSPVPTPSE